jgi:hypothetical protein
MNLADSEWGEHTPSRRTSVVPTRNFLMWCRIAGHRQRSRRRNPGAFEHLGIFAISATSARDLGFLPARPECGSNLDPADWRRPQFR